MAVAMAVAGWLDPSAQRIFLCIHQHVVDGKSPPANALVEL